MTAQSTKETFSLFHFTFISFQRARTGKWWNKINTHTHTHTRLTALCPGLPGWAGTRKVKPIWILLEQETVSGSGTSWAICKSAPRSRQITTPAPHRSVFYRPDALPAAQPTASKHWRHKSLDWYWQTKQYRKIQINKLNTNKKKQPKIQQNKTTLVQLPLTTLSQETRWAYSTTLPSPHN